MISDMKKVLYILLTSAAVASCYDDYIINYDVQAVGFANQTDVRSVVVGESMSFSTGVALGGVITNEENRKVDFQLDYSLVGKETLDAMKVHTFSYIQNLYSGLDAIAPLPAEMYTLETKGGVSGQAVIPKGEHLGKIEIGIKDEFLADDANLLPRYVIPLRITDGHGLSLMEGKTTTVIGVRFENMLFGNWWHGGVAVALDESGAETDRVTYALEIPQADTRVWTLTTVSPHSVVTNAVAGELNGSASQMKLTLEEDGQITIESLPGATYTVSPDGESRFNKAKLLQNRELYLSYKFTSGDKEWHVKDTLRFRNRLRDGVNEWQDENQENY